jgi:hypothetical protein
MSVSWSSVSVGWGSVCHLGNGWGSIDGWGSVHWGGDDLLHDSWSSDTFNLRVESVVVISGVGNLADGTISFGQRVATMDDAVFQVLFSGFRVTGMGVGHTIVEVVRWVGVIRFRGGGVHFLHNWGGIDGLGWGIRDLGDSWGGISDWGVSVSVSSIGWGSWGVGDRVHWAVNWHSRGDGHN